MMKKELKLIYSRSIRVDEPEDKDLPDEGVLIRG